MSDDNDHARRGDVGKGWRQRVRQEVSVVVKESGRRWERITEDVAASSGTLSADAEPPAPYEQWPCVDPANHESR